MTFIAHFRGGPWDGRTLMVPDLLRELRMPQPPPITGWITEAQSSDSFLPRSPLVYRRLTGVVGGEAVYELVG